MARVTISDLAAVLDRLQQQVADLSRRLERLEGGKAVPAEAAPAAAPVQAAAPAAAETVTEEELLAVAAAIGAFLGVRAHIRRIRLISTTAWAQQGRVSIQASHRLQA